MATQQGLYKEVKNESKISINFARYNNSGNYSQLIR
jgi:hypothetical protein